MSRCKQSLVAKIEAAFPDEPVVPDDQIVPDNRPDKTESAEIRAAFRTRRWSSLDIELLAYHHQSLFMMTRQACCYYLPAFLTAVARDYRRSGNIADSILFSLVPPRRGTLKREQFEARFAPLTLAQRQTIHAFLVRLAAKHGADFPPRDVRAALDYWGEASS